MRDQGNEREKELPSGTKDEEMYVCVCVCAEEKKKHKYWEEKMDAIVQH